MKDIRPVVKKITDVVTVAGPAVVAAVGIVSATGAHWANAAVELSMIVLGAVSSAASLIYNTVSNKE